MKTKLLTICLLLFTSQVFAEEFICSVVAADNKSITLEYIRKDSGEFVVLFEGNEIPLIKTYEDKTYLHLVWSSRNYLHARVINKLTGKYEAVGIEESKSPLTDKVYGTCKVR